MSANRIVRAAQLVKEGRVFDLAHVLDEHVPAFPGRAFRQLLTTNPARSVGKNKVNWIVEYVNAPSQMGTHMDGLNHLLRDGRMHGGHHVEDVVVEWGTTENGIETVPQILTRGVLLDIARLHGVEHLDAGYAITPDDAEAALAQVGTCLAPGDAVLLHTGWGRWWDLDGDRYTGGEPGPGLALAEWLVDRGVVLTGCDTWSYGPVPPEDADEPFVVPQTLNVDHGVLVLENLRLEELAAARVVDFLLIVSHPKLRGATGAWVAPLAVI